MASLLLVTLVLPSARIPAALAGRLDALAKAGGARIAIGAAILVGALALLGWFTVYQQYPLSMDEFWAQFDARIFGRGGLLAELPARWRPLAPALQPAWPLVTPDGRFWVSRYLPVNAAFRALFALAGSQALAGPVFACLSVLTTYALGRRLWPERRDAAPVAALLLASSPQLIFGAMCPYAMPAHLALNLIWLWLFFQPRAWGQALAPFVAFAATGLHQLVFHPLFAAPFVLRLWLQRRWRLAAFHTAAYAAICLFWLFYWSIVLKASGVGGATAHALGTGWVAQNAQHLITAPDPGGALLVGLNLLRFIAWQNPLAVALGALGVVAAVRRRSGVFLAMAGGMVATLALLVVIMPFQGHGWGYRYLHGFLGSLCLLATLAWVELTPDRAKTGPGADGGPGTDEERIGAWTAFLAAGVFCVVFALPARAIQTFGLIRPFARAAAAIAAAPAQIVVVDPAGLEYGQDFVRNDPFLERWPKVLNIEDLTPAGARDLCGHFSVALFDVRTGRAFGVRTSPVPPPGPAKQASLAALSCARPLATPPP